MRARPLLVALALFPVRCGPEGCTTERAPGLGSDPTAALQRALDAGGEVRLGGAERYTVGTLVVAREATTLTCTGQPTPATLTLHPDLRGTGAPLLDVRAGGFTLRGCVLDGDRAAQPPGGLNDSFDGRARRAGLEMRGSLEGLTVEGATFQRFSGAAIATRDVGRITVRGTTFRDNAFEAVFADNAFPSGDPGRRLRGFTFRGNVVLRTGSGDREVNANGLLVHQMSDLLIEGNTVDGYERNGLKLENCAEGVVSGNVLRRGALANFGAISMQNGAHALRIEGNDVQDVGTGIDTSLVAGGQYLPDSVEGVAIRGNVIRRVRPGELADGVRVLGFGAVTADVTISGNTIEGVPNRGITLRQFRTFHARPRFAGIAILDNALVSAGPCDFFAGSPTPPADVRAAGNTCR